MNPILQIILITLLPALELRASIPYGILVINLPWLAVFIIAVLTNILLGVLVYLFIDKIVMIATKVRFIDTLWKKYVGKIQKKIQLAVEKYGELGVAIFIAIPLPGSGVYSGAIAAYLIGLEKHKFFVAASIGVFIAAVLVTLITLTGSELFSIFVKNDI
jgi:uncharacterized membrane protein